MRAWQMVGMALALLASTAGCARLGERRVPVVEQPIEITLILDKPAYRPGEPVMATVTLVNRSGRALDLRALDAGSVEFYFSRQGDPEPMKRQAIFSRLEPLGAPAQLVAGQSLGRTFLLTRVTYYGGPLSLMAIYEPGDLPRPDGGEALARASSNKVDYEVAGEPIFEREPNSGLIRREEAIRLAGAKATPLGRVLGGEALPFQDELGFDKWWVNIRVGRADGIEELTGWLVNPYTGRVLRARVPFNPAHAADPRLGGEPPSAPALPIFQ